MPPALPGGSRRPTPRGIARAKALLNTDHLASAPLCQQREVDDPGHLGLQLRSFAAARQNLAFSDMIGGSDNPFPFPSLDYSRCAIVADPALTVVKNRPIFA